MSDENKERNPWAGTVRCDGLAARNMPSPTVEAWANGYLEGWHDCWNACVIRKAHERTQAESAQLNPTNPSPTPHKPSSAQ